MKLVEWITDKKNDQISFKYYEKPYALPKFEIIVDDSLAFSYMWCYCI